MRVKPMLAILWSFHFAFCSALGAALWHYFGQERCASFLVGAILVNLNLLSHGLAWALIFRKKLIALGVSIVVSKYAIIGVLIYLLGKREWFNPNFFVLGIATLSISAAVYGVLQSTFNEEEEASSPQDDSLMFK